MHFLSVSVQLLAAATLAVSASQPNEYDFIIVGGGTAGNYMAHKLATQSSPPAHVLLLEIGADTVANTTGSPLTDPGILTHMPSNLLQNVTSPYVRHTYLTAPQEQLHNRTLSYHRGMALGGTSLLNYMGWSKGYRGDYDAWAKAAGDSAYSGGEGWERLKALETFDGSVPDFMREHVDIKPGTHGTSGPIMNSFGKVMLPGVKAFLEASEEAGAPRNGDFNSGEPIGACLSQQTVHKGVRMSSASALLNTPNGIGAGLQRPSNLEIKTNSRVDKILFSPDRTATGVQLSNGNQYFASKEVVLTAGFIESPKLLLLSGVGPKEHFKAVGIPLVYDSPYVGKNLRDHSSVLLNPQFSEDLELPSMLHLRLDPERAKQEQQHWLSTYNNGHGDASTSEMARFGSAWGVNWQKHPRPYLTSWREYTSLTPSQQTHFNDPLRPSTEIIYLSGYTPSTPRHLPRHLPPNPRPNPSATLLLLNQNTLSRGEILLTGPNPNSPPVVNPRYLTHPMDTRIAVETVKSALATLRTERYRNMVEGVEFIPAGQTPVYLARTRQQREVDRGNMKEGFYTRGLGDTSDAGIEEWLRREGLDQGYHGQGTLRMGGERDGKRVCDADGRVVGLRGLRVADVSVVPVLMVNHPQVSAYLVADVVADRILSQWGMRGKAQAKGGG